MNVELSTGGPLKISEPEDFLVDSNGSYSASGGVAPYTFSSSCGSVDSDTGEILDDANCCSGTPGEINEVEISVTDSCGDTASMQARGKNGHWVTQLNTGPPGWPSNYIRQTLTAGAVRTTYYYTSCGCYFSQEAAANPGGCMGFNSKSNDGNEPAGAIQYYTNTICGENPPSPYTNLEGALYRNGVSSHPGWCYQYGNLFEIYGWRSYCQNSDYIKVEHFECQ